MEQLKPNKEQVFRAFTNALDFEYEYSDEIETLMLEAIEDYKNECEVDHLHEIMTDSIWKKIGRLFQL